jgi:predicted dehydrogenase
MSRIRVSLVGLGLAVTPHARSLAELGDRLDVRWAASRSKQRIAKFAEEYPFPVTDDVERALTDPEVDAVLLLTPPATHLELGGRALQAGKHLLVEKPLEIDTAKAAALVEAARRADRRLGVVLQHRFRKASRRAAELIAAGALGRIEAASVAIPWWRPQTYYDEPGRGTLARDGGGVLMTQAIHTLDLFRSLVGVRAVKAAQAVTTGLHRMETEDFVTALVSLGNGAPGSILATTAAYPGRPERIDIIGSRGSLLLDGENLAFESLDGTTESLDTDAGSSAGANPMGFSHEAHKALISDFLDAVESGRPPAVSGEEALATQLLIERILRTARGDPQDA